MITHRRARRLAIAAPALAALVGAACQNRIPKQPTIEEPPRPASVVRMGDPSEASQLLSGFYQIEGGSWRWTARQFAVLLRPPAQAARTGAVLELHFSIPQASIGKLKSLTLAAGVNGAALPPETYRKAGGYVYRRELAASLISSGPLRVDFQLDKAVEPGGGDERELGIVVSGAGLVAK
jgi:hypothetical protein